MVVKMARNPKKIKTFIDAKTGKKITKEEMLGGEAGNDMGGISGTNRLSESPNKTSEEKN